MKDQRKTEIKVGIMVVVGLLLFIWILSWAKNFSFTSTEKPLLVKFASVSGLEIGDYVMVNGVRKGFVEDFKIQGESVIVRLSLDNDVDLRKDASFAVTMLDLMGGKKVEVTPGISGQELNYNTVQQGVYHADIPAVMAMVGSVQEDIVTSLGDIKITLKSLNNYLTDEELNRDVKASLSNLSDLTSKVNLLIDENRQGIKLLTKNAVDLTSDAKEFISTNKEGINTSIEDMQVVLKRTDTLLTKVNLFTDQLLDKNNNLNKILNNEEIYADLMQTVKQVKELIRILVEQLQNEGINIDANIDIF